MWAYATDAKGGWKQVSKVDSCGTDTTTTYGVTNDGPVYGMTYAGACLAYQGFRWNPAAGLSLLTTATTKEDGSPSNSRPNRVSADGSTIVGQEEALARVTLPPESDGGTSEWIS